MKTILERCSTNHEYKRGLGNRTEEGDPLTSRKYARALRRARRAELAAHRSLVAEHAAEMVACAEMDAARALHEAKAASEGARSRVRELLLECGAEIAKTFWKEEVVEERASAPQLRDEERAVEAETTWEEGVVRLVGCEWIRRGGVLEGDKVIDRRRRTAIPKTVPRAHLPLGMHWGGLTDDLLPDLVNPSGGLREAGECEVNLEGMEEDLEVVRGARVFVGGEDEGGGGGVEEVVSPCGATLLSTSWVEWTSLLPRKLASLRIYLSLEDVLREEGGEENEDVLEQAAWACHSYIRDIYVKDGEVEEDKLGEDDCWEVIGEGGRKQVPKYWTEHQRDASAGAPPAGADIAGTFPGIVKGRRRGREAAFAAAMVATARWALDHDVDLFACGLEISKDQDDSGEKTPPPTPKKSKIVLVRLNECVRWVLSRIVLARNHTLQLPVLRFPAGFTRLMTAPQQTTVVFVRKTSSEATDTSNHLGLCRWRGCTFPASQDGLCFVCRCVHDACVAQKDAKLATEVTRYMPRPEDGASHLLYELDRGKLLGTLKAFFRKVSQNIAKSPSVLSTSAAGAITTAHLPRGTDLTPFSIAETLRSAIVLLDEEVDLASKVLSQEQAVITAVHSLAAKGRYPALALANLRKQFTALEAKRKAAISKMPTESISDKLAIRVKETRFEYEFSLIKGRSLSDA